MKDKVLLTIAFLLLLGFLVQLPHKLAAGSLTQQGDAALKKGDYKAAIALYQKAMEKKENVSEARAGLLKAYWETGGYTEAEQAGAEFSAAEPENVGFLLIRGDAQKARGRYLEAEASYKKALDLARARSALAPSLAEVQIRLAYLYHLLGRRPQANQLFHQVFRLLAEGQPRLTAAEFVALGRAYWNLEKYHEANEAFRSATETDAQHLEGFIERGRLFLEKYDHPYAGELFEKALKLNPNSAAALAGLAESKRMESSSEAAELGRKALAVNPQLEEAVNLLAALQIEAEDYQGALTELDKALQWNPQALETRALRAVCYQFLNQSEKFSAETQKVLAINPHYGQLYHLLAEFSGYRARYAQAAEYNRKAIELTPNLWTSHAALGINLLRLGDEQGGRQSLAAAFAKDPFDVRAKNTLDLLDSFSQYQESKTEHFRLRLHQREAGVMRPYVEEILERAYKYLAARYRFQPTAPLLFEMYPNHADFAVRTFGLPGISASGACFGKVVVMDSPHAKDLKDFNWGSTLWHELTHVFTLQTTEHRIPRWFSEGLSMFEEQRAHPGWGTGFEKQFIKAQQAKRLLKLKELNNGFIRPKRADQVPVSYHQAGLMCAFIDQRYGFDKILALLDEYRRQSSTEEAFKKALGLSLDDFDAAFLKYLESLKLDSPDKPSADPEVLTRVSESNFEAHKQVADSLIKKGGTQAIRRAIEVLNAAIYINPFDPTLHATLGELYRGQDQPALAVREFRVLLALNPADPAQAHYDLANALTSQGLKKEAKAEVLKALEIAPGFDKALSLLLRLTEEW